MIDLKKPRLTAKNENGGCTILGADQIDIECGSVKNAILISNCLYRLFELENAIESGEFVPVVRCKDCANACAEGEQYWCNTRSNLHDGTEYCSQGYVKMDLEGEK